MKKCKDCNKEIYKHSTRCKSCSSKGVIFSKDRKEKISKSKIGKLNPNWKGDFVGYGSIHEWVKRRLKKTETCQLCNKKTKKLDLANISQKYKRNLNDWEYLCRKCHMQKDGRLEKLQEFNEKNKRQPINCAICGILFKRKRRETFCCSTRCGNLYAHRYTRKNKSETEGEE